MQRYSEIKRALNDESNQALLEQDPDIPTDPLLVSSSITANNQALLDAQVAFSKQNIQDRKAARVHEVRAAKAAILETSRTQHINKELIKNGNGTGIGSIGVAESPPREIKIQPGDTLSHISQRTGVSQEDLVKWNNIEDPNAIQIGQTLTLVDPGIIEKVYDIQPGDNLTKISQKTGISKNDLIKFNNISDPNLIRVGQQLQLTATPASSPPPPITDTQIEKNKAAVEASIDKNFTGGNSVNVKAAIMGQIEHENSTFAIDTEEDLSNIKSGRTDKGFGLFQFTDWESGTKLSQRVAYEKWLKDNDKDNSVDAQIEYFKKLVTTSDDAWVAKYHDIGSGNRKHMRHLFAIGTLEDITKGLIHRFERFKGHNKKKGEKEIAQRISSAYDYKHKYTPVITEEVHRNVEAQIDDPAFISIPPSPQPPQRIREDSPELKAIQEPVAVPSIVPSDSEVQPPSGLPRDPLQLQTIPEMISVPPEPGAIATDIKTLEIPEVQPEPLPDLETQPPYLAQPPSGLSRDPLQLQIKRDLGIVPALGEIADTVGRELTKAQQGVENTWENLKATVRQFGDESIDSIKNAASDFMRYKNFSGVSPNDAIAYIQQNLAEFEEWNMQRQLDAARQPTDQKAVRQEHTLPHLKEHQPYKKDETITVDGEEVIVDHKHDPIDIHKARQESLEETPTIPEMVSVKAPKKPVSTKIEKKETPRFIIEEAPIVDIPPIKPLESIQQTPDGLRRAPLIDAPSKEEPFKLQEWTGMYTEEGRKIYYNNQINPDGSRGTSSEYTRGVIDSRINEGKPTHIPSIYNGKIVSKQKAIDIIVANEGKDPETGRLIPSEDQPGGDPQERSQSIKAVDESVTPKLVSSMQQDVPFQQRQSRLRLSTTQEFRPPSVAPMRISPEVLEWGQQQTAMAPLHSTAPVIEAYASPNSPTPNILKHEDGSYTVIDVDGNYIGVGNQYMAEIYSEYHIANIEGRTLGEIDPNFTNQTIASAAYVGELIGFAFAGSTTLGAHIEDWNANQMEGFMPGMDTISSDEQDAFEAKTMKESHPHFQILTELQAQADLNRKQQQGIKEWADNFRDAYPTNRKHAASAIAAFKYMYEHEGKGAALLSFYDNFGAFASMGFDSVGFSVALMVGGLPVQLGMLTTLIIGNTHKLIAEYESDPTNPPLTNEQRHIIAAGSAASLILEKLSLHNIKGVVSALPGMGNPLKWANTVGAKIGTLTSKLPARLAKSLVFKPITGFAGEGAQEWGSQVIEETVTDPNYELPHEVDQALAFATGTAGAPTIAGTIITGKAAVRIPKMLVNPIIQRQRNKQAIKAGLVTITAKLDNLNNQTALEGYDAAIQALEQPIEDTLDGVETSNIRFKELYDNWRKHLPHVEAIKEAKKRLQIEIDQIKAQRNQLAENTDETPIKIGDTYLAKPIHDAILELKIAARDLTDDETKQTELAELNLQIQELEQQLAQPLNAQQKIAQKERLENIIVEFNKVIETNKYSGKNLGKLLKFDGSSLVDTRPLQKGQIGVEIDRLNRIANINEHSDITVLDTILVQEERDERQLSFNNSKSITLDINHSYTPTAEGLEQTNSADGTTKTISLRKQDPNWIKEDGQRKTRDDFKTDTEYNEFLEVIKTYDAARTIALQELNKLRYKENQLTPEIINERVQDLLYREIAKLSKRTLTNEEKEILQQTVENIKQTVFPDLLKSNTVADKLFSGPDPAQTLINVQTASPEQLQQAIDDPNAKPEDIVALRAVLQAQRDSKTQKDREKRKEFDEVRKEIIEGTGEKYTGFHTYRDKIIEAWKEFKGTDYHLVVQRVAGIQATMETHATNLTNKLAAFKQARELHLSTPLPEGSLWVVKGNRVKREDGSIDPTSRKMNYSVEKMTKKAYTAATKSRETGGVAYLTRIDEKSNKLIKGLEHEVALGQSAIASIVEFNKSFIHKRAEYLNKELTQVQEFEANLSQLQDKIGRPIIEITKEAIEELKPAAETAEDPAPQSLEQQLANAKQYRKQLQKRRNDLEAELESEDITFTESKEVQNEITKVLHQLQQINSSIETFEQRIKERDTATKLPEGTDVAPEKTTETPGPAPAPTEESDTELESTEKSPFAPDEFEEGVPESQTTTKTDQSRQAEAAAIAEAKAEPTKLQNFYESAKARGQAVWGSIVETASEKNLDRMLGMLGAIFTDLITIGKEDLEIPNLHNLQNSDFVNEAGEFSAGNLRTALENLGLSTPHARILSSKYKSFRKRYDSSGKAYQANYGIQHPLSILLNEFDNRLPDQVVFTMMIGIMVQRQHMPNNTRFTQPFLKALFLYGGKVKDSDLSWDENAETDQLGYDHGDTADKIGHTVIQLLRFKVKKIAKDQALTQEGANAYYEQLKPALGLMAIEIAKGTDQEAFFEVIEHTWNFATYEEDRNFNNYTNKPGEAPYYKHIKVDETKDPKELKKEFAAVNALIDITDSDVDTQGDKPLQIPAEVSQNFISGTFGKIPRKVKKILRKLQNVKWNTAESMNTLSYLDEEHMETLYDLIGIVPIPKDWQNYYHQAEKESLESSNRDKINSLNEIIEAYDRDGENNVLKDFYFKYELQNHHRLMMKGRINPQGSKVTRFLLQSWGARTFNKDNMWKFKLGVTQNMGLKVDKHELVYAETEFNNLITNSHMLAAIEALQILQSKKGNTKQARTQFAKAVKNLKNEEKYKGGNISILNSITALSHYMTVTSTKDKYQTQIHDSFQSDLVFQADGVSNGFTINVFQFPQFSNLEEILNQTGHTFGYDSQYDPNKDDVYTTLGRFVLEGSTHEIAAKNYEKARKKESFPTNSKIISKQLSRFGFIKQYNKWNNALNTIFPSFENGELRDLVKYPFIIYMYGGGIDRIAKDVTKGIIKDIYTKVGQHHQIYAEMKAGNPVVLQALLEHASGPIRTKEQYYTQEIQPFIDSLHALGAFETGKDEDGNIIEGSIHNGKPIITKKAYEQAVKEGKELTTFFNHAYLVGRISQILAPRFNYGLEQMLGETKKSRDAIVQMSDILHGVFMTHYQIAYQKRLDEWNAAHISGKLRTHLTREEIINMITDPNGLLIQVFPQYIGPLTTMLRNKQGQPYTDEFIDLSATEYKKSDLSLDTRRIEVKGNFRANTNGKPHKSTNTLPSNLHFKAAGVAALIRQIINMDAVILTETLDMNKDENVAMSLLMLHDAFMGSPADMDSVSEFYGKRLLQHSLNHSIMEKTYKQLQTVMQLTEDIARKRSRFTEYHESGGELLHTLEEWIRHNAFINKYRDTSAPISVSASFGYYDWKYLNKYFKDINDNVEKARKHLKDRIKKEGITSEHLFMARPKSAMTEVKRLEEELVDPAIEKRAQQKANPKQRKIVRYSSRDVNTEKDSLLTAIAKIGGIAKYVQIGSRSSNRIQFGDFNVVDNPSYKDHPSGLGPGWPVFRIRSGGLNVDEMRSRLLEAGYLTNPNDPNEIFDKVQKELRGNKQWHPDYYNTAAADNEIVGMFDQYHKSQEETDLEKQVGQDIDSKLKSLDDLERDPVGPETDMGDITKNNVQYLFQKFKEFSHAFYPSQEKMDEHTQVLDRVLNILNEGITAIGGIRLSVEHINGIAQGEYDIARNSMRMSLSNQPPFSNNAQSPQEVYVHELLHSTTALAIRENPLVGHKIERLYIQTENSLNKKYGEGQGYKVFLEGIARPSVNDRMMAKKQYKYLFQGREKARLHEFLAYAVTNKHMVNYLSTQPAPRREGLLGQLVDAIIYAINILREAFGIRTYRNIHDDAFHEMLAATEHLVALQAKHESKYELYRNRVYGGIHKSDKMLQQLGEDVFRKIMQPQDKPTFGRKLAGAAAFPIFATMSNNPRIMKMRHVYDRILNKTLRGIAHEVGAGAMTEKMIEQLLHVQVNIAKARRQAETFTIDWFNGKKADPDLPGIWKSVDSADKHSMSGETKIALTEVLFRTDLSALLDLQRSGLQPYQSLTHKKIIDLVVNPDARRYLQRQIQQQLRLPSNHLALQYAQELGWHIATGKTGLGMTHQNTFTIALNYLKNPTAEHVMLLDAYATLFALEHTDSRQVDLVHTLSQSEFAVDGKENGIIDLLDSHAEFKQHSRQELFRDDPTHMQKGYIVERVDNYTHIKTGTKADIPRMKKLGYSEHYELTQVVPGQTHDTLFVTRTIPDVTDVSGVMSTTNQRHMGTSITEILVQDPAYQFPDGHIHAGRPDMYRIEAAVDKFVKQQERQSHHPQWNNKLNLRALRDADTKIIDYRVMMDHQTMKEILRPDLEIQNVFAHMRSAVVDRVNTIQADKKTVELLVYEQIEMKKDNSKLAWINILDPTSAYADRYRKLPYAVREYIKQYALDGEFLVREDIIDKVFGYKSHDLTQKKLVQMGGPTFTRIVGVTHHVIKETVGYGKNRVVIAMPRVVIGNMMSNIYQLLMRKIPIEFIFHKIYEGIHEYNKYDRDTRALMRLTHQIRSKRLDPKTSQEALQVARLQDRIAGNKIHQMSAAGLQSLIVEDINDAETEGYFNKMRKLLLSNEKWYGQAAKQFSDKLPSQVGDAAAVLFMTKNSKPYQAARHVVQMTDFLGRYVMIEHDTKINGRDFNSAMHEALNAFVLFDEALVPALEALDVVGVTSFLSYWLRNARASRRLVSTNPTSVGISAIVQHATGVPTLGNINSSWLGGDFAPNYLQTDDLFDEANNVTLFEVVSDFDLKRDLFN